MASETESLLFDLQSEIEDMRVSACRILAKVGDETAVGPLMQATKDEVPAVRYFAGKALDAVKKRLLSTAPQPQKEKTDSITSLIEKSQFTQSDFTSLLHDPDEKTRIEVIDNASRISLLFDKRIVLASLIALLGKEKSTFVLPSLVKNIGLLGDAAVAFILIPYLKHEDARVRANTVEALEYLNSPSVFLHILPLLKDPDHRVKANAAMALQSYGETNALKIIKGMIDSKEVWMRDAATFALGEIRNKDSAVLLAEVLRHEPKYGICVKAVKGLEQIGGRIVLPLVLKLRSVVTDGRKQRMIDYLVRKFNGEQVSLQDFLDDEAEVEDIQWPARTSGEKEETEEDRRVSTIYDVGFEALDRGNYQDAIDCFQAICTESPNSSYAPIARYMIEVICEEKGIALATPGTAVPEEREKQAPAVEEPLPMEASPLAAPEAPDEIVELVEQLIKDLANPDEDVRERAVFKLMAIDDPRAIKPLTRAAMDQDNVVRYFAKKALKKFQEAEAKKSFLETEKAQAVKRSLVEIVGKRNLAITVALCVVLALASAAKFTYTFVMARRTFSQAEDLFIKARYKEAIPLFEAALETDPHNVRAYARLADIYYLTNRYSGAITKIKQIGKIDKTSVDYLRFSAKRLLLSIQQGHRIVPGATGESAGQPPDEL